MPKLGLGITTYSNESTADGRIDIISESFESLKGSLDQNHGLEIVIVVDGSFNARHKVILNKFSNDFKIIYKDINGGISKAKNTCMRYLYDLGCDILFITDDDIIYKKNWYNFYKDNMVITNIQFMHFIPQKYRSANINKIKSVPIISTAYYVGCMFILTRYVIDKIGYFPVLPGKYGYEHVIYQDNVIAQKIIDGKHDFVDSLAYIELNEKSYSTKSFNPSDAQFDPIKNAQCRHMKYTYVPCIE